MKMNPDTTRYVYDGIYAVCELEGDLSLKYKYIYTNGLLLARYDASPADTHYYHHDGLGSVMGMTDGTMLLKVEQSYFYDEFGNSLGSWGSISNHYLYTGQEYDGSISSLYNLRARYYDMRLGRFVSEDPIWQSMIAMNTFGFSCRQSILPQDFNPYPYVVNNPVNMIDPAGLRGFWNWCGRGWAGGKPKFFEEMTDKEKKNLKPPTNWIDFCCMEHDYCYYDCREGEEKVY